MSPPPVVPVEPPPARARPRWLILLAALALMALTARLGWWQLDRAAQKKALQTAIEAQADASALPASALPADEPEATRQRYRRITLQGQWMAEHTVYLENRQMRGRPGFFVLTPLKLPTGDAVLVQRGWLPRDLVDRTRIAPYRTAEGEVQIQGRIVPWPSHLTALGAEASGAIRQNLDFADEAARVQRALRPFAIAELDQPGHAKDGLLRDWPMPAVDVHKHYGYAAQWFALCALTAGLYVWFQLIRPRRRQRAGGPD
ncbi:MAG TPA: SURF1 family protein [Ideonella sp.]|uniref:SURF1 family protein n=1 Tax=Ideonella sp. TaxID=1929293 RepID=UPI002E2EFBA7|nr:SURF1 family protein [Ideonella sp.]HEX5686685.1 SURF1 family protein [Ideonella sp.]